MGARGFVLRGRVEYGEYVLTQILAHGRVLRGVIGIVAEHVVLPQSLRHSFGLTQPGAIGVRGVQSPGPAEAAGLISLAIFSHRSTARLLRLSMTWHAFSTPSASIRR